MKRRIVCLLLICVMVVPLLAGCRTGTDIPEHFQVWPLNRLRDINGSKVTLTSASVVDRYVAPDGTVYTPEPDGDIIVVTAEVDMLDGWGISAGTYLTLGPAGDRLASLLCDPIEEISADGEKVINTLLFGLNVGEFNGFLEDYGITLVLEGNRNQTERWFYLSDYPTVFPMNMAWKYHDDWIALSEVVKTDQYTTPDGTVYQAEKKGTLVILKFRGEFTRWQISTNSTLRQASRENVYPTGETFTEVGENGQEYHVLLFRLEKEDDYRDPESYTLYLKMNTEDGPRTEHFYLHD